MKYIRSSISLRIDTSRLSTMGLHFIDTILQQAMDDAARFVGKENVSLIQEKEYIDTAKLRTPDEDILYIEPHK